MLPPVYVRTFYTTAQLELGISWNNMVSAINCVKLAGNFELYSDLTVGFNAQEGCQLVSPLVENLARSFSYL